MGDVIRNVSGVSLTQVRQGVAETITARGYTIGIGGGSSSIYKNGFLSNTTGFPDASTLESIEVLKGTSALQYGNVSSGLIINMVTKKPRFDWGGSVSMLAGSYNDYKPTVDLYGPITKNLAFRVVATHEDAKSYRDVVQSHRTYVNPSLLYKIGKKTDILLEGDYLKSDITPDAGVGYPNNRITVTSVPEQPRNRYINVPWTYENVRQASADININHHFNDHWRLSALAAIENTEVRSYGVSVPMTVAANGDWSRSLSAAKNREKDITAQLNLNGQFTTGFLKHQVLVGGDFVRIQNNTFGYTYPNAKGVSTTAYDIINIFDPTKYVARTDIPAANVATYTYAPQSRFNVFAQDLISLTDKFKVLAGLGYTFQTVYHTNVTTYATGVTVDMPAYSTTVNGVSVPHENKSDHAVTPRVALLYQPVPTSSVYVTYSNSFVVNTGIDVNNHQLDPSIVNLYEAGIKNEFLNGKLTANASIYRIHNNHTYQTAIDPTTGLLNTNTAIKQPTGQTTSDGVEVDFSGNLSRNFYFITGYSYNFARYTQTAGTYGSQVEGERLVATPKETANGTIFYTLTEGTLKGLKFGATAFYTGKRYGGNNNVVGARPGELNSAATRNATTGVVTYTSSYNSLLPLTGFTTVDLSAGYAWHRVSLLTKVSNIFNTYNYLVHDRYSLNPIPPRMFIATLAYRFGKL